MRRILRTLILLAVALVAATTVNAVRPNGIKWFVSRETIYPPPTRQQREAGLPREQVRAAIEKGLLIIDARRDDQYQRGHIPTAVNLPAETAAENLEKVFERADLEDPIIVYCGGADCEDSREVFELLKGMGFRNVRLYFGGWEDWLRARMPIEEQ